MIFGNLDYLWFISVIPVLAVFFIIMFFSREKKLLKFADKDLIKSLLESISFSKQIIKPAILILSVIFIILALIEPKWGYKWQEVKRRGLDIVIAVDVSKSMLAEDIKPNRIQAARREIKSLINRLRGDRIGIVAFAGAAFIYCPLTLDYGTAKLFIDNISVGIIPVAGTDIGAAIEKSLNAFKSHKNMNRVLILITDGEDHGEGIDEAIKEAKKHEVIIYTVGLGRREGAPIPYYDASGRKSFLKDKSGKIVLSKLNDMMLKRISWMTGGKSASISQGIFSLEDIYLQEISKLEKKELMTSKEKRYQHRFQIPLFIAILLLFIEGILDEKKRYYKLKRSGE